MKEWDFNSRDYEIIEFFRKHLQKNEIYSRKDLKELIKKNTGPNINNIAALTYDRWNDGMGHPLCIFQYERRGEYSYLDINFPYNGDIFHYPSGSGGKKVCVGKWENGICVLGNGESFIQTQEGYSNLP